MQALWREGDFLAVPYLSFPGSALPKMHHAMFCHTEITPSHVIPNRALSRLDRLTAPSSIMPGPHLDLSHLTEPIPTLPSRVSSYRSLPILTVPILT